MSEMLILVRAPIQANLGELDAYRKDVLKKLKSVKGFSGTSFWLKDGDPKQMLHVYEYANLAAAEEGLRKIVADDLPVRSSAFMTEPASVIRMRVVGYHGQACQTSPLGTFLSMSVRLSEPGHGADMDRDLETVVDELSVIPGYIGGLRGCNDVLEEEIIGIILWDHREAFDRSIPPQGAAEVELYQKVL